MTDYYLVLGVPKDESAAGIRSAYRTLAKQVSPGFRGEHRTKGAQEIAEAYRILSDSGSRREYDEQARSHELPGPAGPAEPVVPVEDSEGPFHLDLGSLLGNRDSVLPSFDAMYDRFLRNFTGHHVPKSERLEGIDLDLVLSVDEALRGGVVHIPVPVFITCSACGGSGYDCLFPCIVCSRQGVVESERRAAITVPPMTRPGTIIEVPLEGLGIHNFFLRLRVSVKT